MRHTSQWESRNAWIAHFDILGFKDLLVNGSRSIPIAILQSQIDDLIDHLDSSTNLFKQTVGYYVFSDTFVLYGKTGLAGDYQGLVSASKRLIEKAIQMGLPIRGAISYGDCVFGYENKILMGKAFLECHEFGEDQDWLGLILTPSAVNELKNLKVNPEGHGFINSSDIPLRKRRVDSEHVYAYKFISGSTSFECPLLIKLDEMRRSAPDLVKRKYDNSIAFIKKYYVVHG